MLTLEYTSRDDKTKAEDVRKEGNIPAVFYGPKEKSQSIAIDSVAFLKTLEEAGESTVITLKEGATEHEALIHEVQYDPVKDTPIHADFYIIEKGKKVEVSVPLIFEGVSPAEKNLGGVLVKVMHELDIEAMPKDLPQELVVNTESLVDFDAVIKAGDIPLPSGVELMVDKDETIALVQAPKEEEEEPAEAPDLDSIEVEEKGKKEEEGGETKEEEKKKEE